MRTRGPSAVTTGRSLFAELTNSGRHDLGLGLAAPLGFVAHAVAIGGLAMLSLTSTSAPIAPTAVPASVLTLAPPPALAYRLGTATGERHVSVEPVAVSEVSPRAPDPGRFATLPEEILSVRMELPEGVPEGLEDGGLDGMSLGLEAGVVGGVPGGTAGGVIGGTGTAVPDLPTPDVGPRPIRMPRARYTEEAIRNNITGAVKLRALIDEQGKVRVLEVTQSIPELDEIAIRTVESSWLFQPATRNGRPVACVSRLEVSFNLR